MLLIIIDESANSGLCSEIFFKSFALQLLGQDDINQMSEDVWKPIADLSCIIPTSDFKWDEVEEDEFPVFMGDAYRTFVSEAELKHFQLYEEAGAKYCVIPDSKTITALSRRRDSKGISKFEMFRGQIADLPAIEKGLEVVSTMTEWEFADSVVELTALLEQLEKAKTVAFDFETKPREKGLSKKEIKIHSLDHNKSIPTALVFCDKEGFSYVVPMFHHHSPLDLGKDTIVELEGGAIYKDGRKIVGYDGRDLIVPEDDLQCIFEKMQNNIEDCQELGIDNLMNWTIEKIINPIFENPEIEKVGHNFKFDYKIARKSLGSEFQGRCTDTLIMDHLIREDIEHGLKDIAARYWPEFIGYDDGIDFLYSSLHELCHYCAIDGDLTLRLRSVLEQELLKDERSYLCWRNYEGQKLITLGEMEYEGMQVDEELLEKNLEKVTRITEEKQELLLNHPITRKFIAAKTKEQAAERLQTVVDYLDKNESAKIEALETKLPTLKLNSAPHKKAVRSLELLKSKEYSAEDYPYKSIKIKGLEYVELSCGQGVEPFDFNLNSGAQLGELIYGEHGLGLEMPVVLKTKKSKVTGKNQKVKEASASTSKDQLALLEDSTGILGLIIILGVLQTIKSTYLGGIQNALDKDGKVHSSFSTVKSMRLSSSNPNLQNITSRTDIEELEEIVEDIKRMFVPDFDAEGDFEFFQCDLSQAELRWLAWKWNIRSMKKALKNNIDLHILASSNSQGMSLEEYFELKKVDPKLAGKLRHNGKADNFGFVYKTSPEGYRNFAKTSYKIDMSLEEAKRRHHKYLYVLHPDIPKAHDRCVKEAQEFGYVRTAFGAKRHTPAIHDFNNAFRAADERVAVNSPIQGSSGQGMVFSIAIFRLRMKMLLGKEHRKQGKTTNTVHDSALGFVLKSVSDLYLTWLRKSMSCPPTLPYFGFDFAEILMRTDVEKGPNWKDVKKYLLPELG